MSIKFHNLLGQTLNLSALLLITVGLALDRVEGAGQTPEAVFVVDSLADTDDAIPGDGNCDDGSGNCTLRAAISEANALAGADAIGFMVNGTITLTGSSGEDNNASGDLDIIDDLTINGNGVENTIIEAGDSAANGVDRVFHIPSGSGLAITLNELNIRHGNAGSGSNGGGILNISGTLTVTGSLINGNTAGNDGGGISNQMGTLTVNDSTISDNSATGGTTNDGGGIHSFRGTQTINHSTISSNSAGDDGGGLFASGMSDTTINNSAIISNTVSGDTLNEGGGLFTIGPMVINNSTISNNSASGGTLESTGGGVAADGDVEFYNSTLSGNSVSGSPTLSGGGIHVDDAPFDIVIMENSIITLSTGGDCGNTGGGFNSATGNNLIDDNASGPCSGISSAAVSNFDGALGDNGGSILTHALLAGSNAIDTGASSCPDDTATPFTLDQRGVTRPLDGDGDSSNICDVGAFEAGALQCGIQAAAEPATYTFFGNVSIEINDDGTDLDCLQAADIPYNHPEAPLGIQTGRNWIFHALQSDGSTIATNDYNADLTLPHNVTPDTSAFVCKWLEGTGPGAGWDCDRTSSTTTTVTRDDVPDFSDWAVGDSVDPTSISLLSVTVSTPVKPAGGLLLGLLVVLAGIQLIAFRRQRQ